MKLSAQWIREFVQLSVNDRRLAEDLTSVGIAVEGMSGTGADTVFEMEIGTNRPDAMNHYGVAREAAAIFDLPLKALEAKMPSGAKAPSSFAERNGAAESRTPSKEHQTAQNPSAAKAAASRGPGATTEVVPFPVSPSSAPSSRDTSVPGTPTSQDAPFPITVEEPDLCPRFSARVIRGITVKPSPQKIAQRLELLGHRLISNAVDATNYVLWEMGKPTHVFDMDLLEGGRLIIRHAKNGEKLKTLDGVERALTSEDLVVADAKKPVGLAGVMGGFDTMITNETRNILIESAWWDPVTVRKMSRRHGIHTDASHRFERGADFESTVLSCDLVAGLILESGGGELVGDALDVVSRQIDQAPVVLRVSEVRRILGGAIGANEIFRILNKLGFVLIPEGQGEAQFRVQIPSWRLDVEREIDLIEEIARLHGYDKFPNTLPAYSGAVVELPHAAVDAALRTRALALGYNEALSLTFISHSDAERFESFGGERAPSAAEAAAEKVVRPQKTNPQGLKPDSFRGSYVTSGTRALPGFAQQQHFSATSEAGSESNDSIAALETPRHPKTDHHLSGNSRVLELENPLSEEASVMRTTLIPGMLDMLAWNLNRDAEYVRLFEMGRVYEMRGGARVESARACLGASWAAVKGSIPVGAMLDVGKGQKSPPKPKEGLSGAPSVPSEMMEVFRSFKGDVESMLVAFEYGDLTFDRETAEYFDPGRSARALMDGAAVAQFGQVAEAVKAERKLRQDIFLAEIDLEQLRARGIRAIKFSPLAKYPAVERDFSFVFGDEVEFEAMRRAVLDLGITELSEFRPVEIFRGGSIAAGKYSILLRVKLQSDQGTLRDEQIGEWSARIAAALQNQGGVQRA